MDFKGTLIDEIMMLPRFWWLWLCAAAAVCFGICVLWSTASDKKPDKGRIVFKSLFAAYVLFILFVTILNRSAGESAAELVPFWSYHIPELRAEIILNYILFIPFGFLLAMCTDRHLWTVAAAGFILSASVETAQLVFGIGLFEFDDMIGNTAGTVFGLLAAGVVKHRTEIK